MATAENAKLEYEAGQSAFAMQALSDSGDQTVFESAASFFSRRSGFEPVVKPDGLLTGGEITPSGSDSVSVAALTLNLAGLEVAVSSGSVTIDRPVGDVALVTSITVDSSGSLVAVAGTDGADASFSETRGAAGGPPYIPVGSVEIGQVRVTTQASATPSASQIFQVVGLHQERADFPIYNLDYSAGEVEFINSLATTHTGDLPKGVYASFHAPIFAEISLASDFVPPETTHTVNSTQIYGTTLGNTTSTLNQGTFTAFLENGVNDPLVTLKNEILWFRFYPSRYASGNILTQGKLGVARTFPADDNIQAACTINAEQSATEVN